MPPSLWYRFPPVSIWEERRYESTKCLHGISWLVPFIFIGKKKFTKSYFYSSKKHVTSTSNEGFTGTPQSKGSGGKGGFNCAVMSLRASQETNFFNTLRSPTFTQSFN